MDDLRTDDDLRKPTHLKLTMANAMSAEPTKNQSEGEYDCTPGICNGTISGASSAMGDNAGTASSYERQKHKSNSSSSMSSPSSSSKDVSRSKDSPASENPNGFTKPKDYHSSSSSPSKHRGHSSSSKENERVHAYSLSTHKDSHSSSKSREHSTSSSRPESGSKHKDGSGGSSREGSRSKPKEGVFSGLNKVEPSSKNSDGQSGDKVRGMDGFKSHSSSSQFSSSSHKEKHRSGSRVDSDKVLSKGDSKSPEKQQHHHHSDTLLPTDATKRSGMSSPAKVKSETRLPSKSQDSRALIKSDEDEAFVLDRLQNADSDRISSLVKSEPKDDDDDDDDDAPLFSRLQKTQVKPGSDVDDDDVPLMSRLDRIKNEEKPSRKRKHDDSGNESDEPLSARIEKVKKIKIEAKGHKKQKHEDDDFAPKKHGSKKQSVKKEEQESPKKGRKKLDNDAADETNWKWWEENKRDEGVKWNTLEHKGPVFAPPYEPLPSNVKFYYDGKVVQLSGNAEEVATFYGKMLDHDYTTRELFNSNFFKDWRKVMTSKERELITDLRKCNFKEIDAYFKLKSEERKNMSKDEKLALKKENEKVQKEFGFCIIDGHKQKIGNFKIEPPGLFRGRGDHPKQGMLKRRTRPEDVIINCSKGSKVPNPPPGHKWKEVRHDNTVTWLASWSENIQGSIKYIMLNAASKLKGEKDWMKYETARRLHKCVDRIRRNYREDWKSKEMKIRQRAVALYFIDKLALRAGNEKDEDTADTVGCCSLRVEHIKLNEEMNGQEFVVEFDFLGKDSIRYYNAVAIEKRVFKNLQLFMENKQEGDDVFDRLNTAILNKHLQSLMDGLTAKVFRTYNASRTLQEQLDLLTDPEDGIPAKLLSYNRANRAVAVLCNHQRAAPKNFDKQMENIQVKIDAKKDTIRNAKKDLKDAKSDYKARRSETAKNLVAKKERVLENLKEQLKKLEVQATDKDENKEIALSTSKLNYLDPRITVAWCKKWEVPIEKVYNKTQREKFAWAIDMADKNYHF